MSEQKTGSKRENKKSVKGDDIKIDREREKTNRAKNASLTG